jgi:hypothetical protein
MRFTTRIATFAAAAALIGCAHSPHSAAPSTAGAPAADSVTIALWRMDEQSGTRLADGGPLRLTGIAGRAVQHPFGRFGNALGFELSIDSFALVPYHAGLESPKLLTVEAWVYPTAYGNFADTPIAGRWTEEANQQSWIFTLAGRRLNITLPGQGARYHLTLFPDVVAGRLMFAYQPAAASPPRAYVSTRTVEINRWTHVAAVFDGQVVRFYLDGELDSQFASLGAIRASEAPLLIGNYFDLRSLTGFEGDLHPDPADPSAYYAFQGKIDELRLSNAARQSFPTRAPH